VKERPQGQPGDVVQHENERGMLVGGVMTGGEQLGIELDRALLAVLPRRQFLR
jgi:hypothetical protein